MSKYIDSEKLIAEIDNNIAYCQMNYSDDYALGFEQSLREVKNFINFLQQEQPEVDLVTEYDEQFDSDAVYGKLANRNAGIAIARHFYELGLNARKEE